MLQAMIENQIFTYILSERKVCLEGIGGFLVKEVPAFNNSKGKSFIPPTIKVFFSENLQCNNTDFIFYMAEIQGISFFEAKRQFDQFVATINHQLKTNNSAELEILGKLIRKDSHITFVPSQLVNELERFGFEELPTAGFENEISKLRLTNNINPAIKKYAAAASLIISLLFIPTNNPSDYNTSSLSFVNNNISSIKASTPASKYINKINSSYFDSHAALFPTAAKKESESKKLPAIKLKEEIKNISPVSKEKTPAPVVTPKATNVNYYGIVIGAFKDKNNAEKVKNRYSSEFDITIKKVNGLFRVIAGKFTTKHQALQFKEQLASKKINGWLSKY